MGSNNARTTKLSLVPLPKGSVLLPGATLRIPVANRPDLSNLLSSILDRTPPGKRDGNTIAFGCVPLGSPHLSKDGQRLIDDGSLDDEKKEEVWTDIKSFSYLISLSNPGLMVENKLPNPKQWGRHGKF